MQADKVFKALGDPTRRKLLDLLCEENGQTLGELCEGVEMTRQAVSQHLAVLRSAGLVTTRRDGSTVYYRLADPRVLEAYRLIQDIAR